MIPLGIISSTGSSLPTLSSSISITQSGSYVSDSYGNLGFYADDDSFYSTQHDVNKVNPTTYTITLTGTPILGNPISQPLANKPVAITFSVDGVSLTPTMVNTDESGEIVISNNTTLQGYIPYNYWELGISVSFAGESSSQEIWSSSRAIFNRFFTDQTNSGGAI